MCIFDHHIWFLPVRIIQIFFDIKSGVIHCCVKVQHSGRDVDKWKEAKLTPGKAETLQYAPIIEECPVSIECKVVEVKELGSHHMFLAEVSAVQVDDAYMNEQNKFELNKTGLLAYSHGEYLGLGKKIGTFGYSVRKKKGKKKSRR